MNNKILHSQLLVLVLLGFMLYAAPLSANCLEQYHENPSSDWTVNASVNYNLTNLESTDQYLSGPAGTEDWEAINKVDGDIYGFSIIATPPILGKRLTMDFSYHTGDLSGTFNTREISPAPEGPYYGTVKFDRDEWELGVDVFILNAVYVRLGYSTFEMDGDWVYSDGYPNEPQKYEFDAYYAGVGFRQNYYLRNPDTVFESNFGILVDVFGGLSSFNYKHTEQLTGASVETDDVGYELRAELLGTYKVSVMGDSRIFAGVGYTYKKNEDGAFDLAENIFTAKLGVRSAF